MWDHKFKGAFYGKEYKLLYVIIISIGVALFFRIMFKSVKTLELYDEIIKILKSQTPELAKLAIPKPIAFGLHRRYEHHFKLIEFFNEHKESLSIEVVNKYDEYIDYDKSTYQLIKICMLTWCCFIILVVFL